MNILSKYRSPFWLLLVQTFLLFGLKNLAAQNITPEKAIHIAYKKDEKTGNQIQLERINKELQNIFETTDNTFNRYWLSYGLYNQALLAGIQEDEDRAEFLIDRAIELLNPFKDDGESLALLSLEQGYSTQYKGFFSLMSIGRNAVLNALLAIELSPNSLRANFAVAINDFYTPKVFGGGRLTLKYLKKALKDENINSLDSLPKWGKPSVYELLFKYHKKIKKDSIAQSFLSKGLVEFPESELLKSLN